MLIQKYFSKLFLSWVIALASFQMPYSLANAQATSSPQPIQKTQLTKDEFISFLKDLDISSPILYGDHPLSRYELTRLLNAVECEDCFLPSPSTVRTYTQSFWSSFIQLPWKDFRDIGFKNAPHEGKDYYYCVAYIGDKTYMRWYPLAMWATSPKCAGNFCGAGGVTRAEFYQTLTNLLSERVASKYTASRGDIKDWLKKLQKSDWAYRQFSEDELQTIQISPSRVQKLKDGKELNIYLKYCTYEPRMCWFTTFPQLQSGVWPLGQVNLLIQEGIITAQDVANLSQVITPKEAVDKLYYIYMLHTKCNADLDYDCDWIPNHKDNCPNTYNPSQADMDTDGYWDVCDDDIDWDREKNPIWLVDETWNIDYQVVKNQTSTDKTPLGVLEQGNYAFLQIKSIWDVAPYELKAELTTKKAQKLVEWDFWDGQVGKWTRVTHDYQYPWVYTIRAKTTGKNWEVWVVSNQIFIWESLNTNYALNIKTPKIQWDTATLEAESLGRIDSFKWSNSANTSSKTSDTSWSFITQLLSWARNNIILKGFYQGKLVAVASIDIRYHKGKYISSSLIFSPFQRKVGMKSIVSTRLSGLMVRDVRSIKRDLWDGTNFSNTQLVSSHTYTEAGGKTVVQRIELDDGQELITTSSFTLQNPKASWNYAVNIWYLSFTKWKIWIQISPLWFKSPIPQIAVSFTPSEQITKTQVNPDWEPIYYDLGYQGALKLKSTAQVYTGLMLNSESMISPSSDTTQEKDSLIDTKVLFSGLKCDLDKDWIPDLYDSDIDGDGKPNLLWLVIRENVDCSLVPGDNVNMNLYNQHFWVCSLDNCPLESNPDQIDLNANGVWDSCEWKSACWDGKIDQWETCLSCPQDVWECTSICGNGKAEPGEDCENCPQDVPICKNICWNGKVDPGETCKTCPEDVPVCEKTCWNGKVDQWETCKTCPEDIPNCPSLCWDGKIDQWETCKTCPEDVKRCFSLCWNGLIEFSLGEECDDGQENWKNWTCSSTCKNLTLCWNGKIDQWETCNTCPQDVPTCDRDDDGIPDVYDQCPDIPEDKNGIEDEDGCPEIPTPCTEDWDCPLVNPLCNSCPCQFADFSNTLHKNDSLRAKLFDQKRRVEYNYSPFVDLKQFIYLE